VPAASGPGAGRRPPPPKGTFTLQGALPSTSLWPKGSFTSQEAMPSPSAPHGQKDSFTSQGAPPRAGRAARSSSPGGALMAARTPHRKMHRFLRSRLAWARERLPEGAPSACRQPPGPASFCTRGARPSSGVPIAAPASPRTAMQRRWIAEDDGAPTCGTRSPHVRGGNQVRCSSGHLSGVSV